MENPEKLIADMNEAAAALAPLPDGHRLSTAVVHGRQLLEQMHKSLEAVTALAEAAAVRERVPEWVADFLNRRTEVELVLRVPVTIRKKNEQHGTDNPVPAPLTPDEMWDLANKLSVPIEFGTQGSPS